MRKVFVTGGAGFIGRHVVRDLVARNIEVVSCDLIEPVERLDGVEYHKGTIMDRHDMAQRMRGCDGFLHLAAVIGVRRATVELLNCLNVNILGTVTALDAAVMAGVPEVLITSSSEVFGDSCTEPYHETAPFNPKSAYAVSKLAGEEYALAYSREYGLAHRIVRFFNVYGPGQAKDFVMSIFADRVARGEPLEVYGDGSQVRAFCHVADAARTTVDAALHSGSEGHTFNIGNDQEPTTILELARLFAKIGGLGPDMVRLVEFCDSDRTSEREIYRRVPDVSKAAAMLNHRPRVSLREGIADIIDAARRNRKR